MSELKVNLRTRDCKNSINYNHNNKTLYIVKTENDHISFMKENIEREVKSLHSRKRKQFAKILKTIQMSSILTLGVNHKAFAQTEAITLIEGLPTQDSIMELVKWAIEVATTLGIGVGIIWLIATRILYFYPKKDMSKKALELGTNAIKGITETILVSPIIGIIIVTAYLLLGKSPFFHFPL